MMPNGHQRTWPERLTPNENDAGRVIRSCPDVGLHDAHPWAEQSFHPFHRVQHHWSDHSPYTLERVERVEFFTCPGVSSESMRIVVKP